MYHRTIRVNDFLGREVAVSVNDRMSAGIHEAVFNTANLASGVYYYRLVSGGNDGDEENAGGEVENLERGTGN